MFISKKKKVILESHGWYKNILGGYVHPHAMDWLSWSEILSMSVKQLEAAVTYGSRSIEAQRK